MPCQKPWFVGQETGGCGPKLVSWLGTWCGSVAYAKLTGRSFTNALPCSPWDGNPDDDVVMNSNDPQVNSPDTTVTDCHYYVPSGKLTQLLEITIFNGKTHYKW